VKHLNARRVIVCELSPRNFALLLRNVANNGYEGRIEPINKALTVDGENLSLDVDAPDECQNMISAYCASDKLLTAVPGISLAQLLDDYSLDDVDLLKMDIEGAEYDILDGASTAVLSRIRNIVFEYHEIERGWERLENVKQRLSKEGYHLQAGRGLIWASRPTVLPT
jgi:FkbM family methyltransferase